MNRTIRRNVINPFPKTFLAGQFKRISPDKTLRYRFLARSFSQIFAIFAIFIGGAVLVGWNTNNYYLTSFYPRFPAMAINSALGVIALGLAILTSYIKKNVFGKAIYYFLSTVVLALGFLTLAEYISHIDLHIDKILLVSRTHLSSTSALRMAPNSALIFLFCGLGLFSLGKKRGRYTGELSILFALVLLLPTLIGYLYGVDFIYQSSTNTKLALPTTLSLTLSIFGLLLSYIDRGYFPTIVSDSTGGFLSRRIFLITVILPLLIGWFILIGSERGLYGQEFRFLLQVAAWIVIFTYVIWRNAISLDKIDMERKQGEQNAQYLAEASKILSSLGDYKKSIKELTELTIKYIADWCSVSMVNPNGKKELLSIANKHQGRLRFAKEYIKKHNLDSLIGYSLKRKPKFETVEFYPTVTEEFFKRHAVETARRMLLTNLHVHSVMLIPIIIRGEIRGKIAFLRTVTKRPFTLNDLAIADDLGRRVSLAIYSTQLFEEAKNAIALRDEFISVASHELKTPLTSLKAYIQLLERQKDKQVTNGYLSKMDEQADRLTRLIQDLLNVSRIRTGKMTFAKEFFDFNQLLQDTIRSVRQSEKTHDIHIDGKATQLVQGDRDRIGQVITNLLTNAIRYSPEAHEVNVRVSQLEDELQISVQDFGVGIDKRNQKKIFDRFYQVNAKKGSSQGLGIGLYISKEIIDRHNGYIWVESKKGKGSTFYFSLPCNR